MWGQRGAWGQQLGGPDHRAQHEGSHNVSADGWFGTGDVANIDRFGHVQLTDRAKDVIKSGGEWISSIDLENVAVGHPQARAAPGARAWLGTLPQPYLAASKSPALTRGTWPSVTRRRGRPQGARPAAGQVMVGLW